MPATGKGPFGVSFFAQNNKKMQAGVFFSSKIWSFQKFVVILHAFLTERPRKANRLFNF